MGLPVGSGVVESACGAVVADRLKRGGMRWTVCQRQRFRTGNASTSSVVGSKRLAA